MTPPTETAADQDQNVEKRRRWWAIRRNVRKEDPANPSPGTPQPTSASGVWSSGVEEFRLLAGCVFVTLFLIFVTEALAFTGVALDWIPEPVAHVMLESVAKPLTYAVVVFVSVVSTPQISRAIRILRSDKG